MRYHGSKDGQLVELPVEVKKLPGVENVYAHGAAGGAVANYHFRLDFYRDNFPPTEVSLIGNQIIDGSVNHIDREIVASVSVPFPFLKELRNWIDRQIGEFEQQYGEIQLPKKEDEEEAELKSKKA